MADEQKLYSKLNVQTKNAEALIEGEIPFDRLASYLEDALADLQSDFEYPGFRKGKVPSEIVAKHANQVALLEDAANRALQEIYPQIIEDEHIAAVTAPEVTVTKLAPGNPLGFKIRVGVRPEVKLPDYRKIGKNIPPAAMVEVTDAEVDAAIKQIMEMRERLVPKAKDEAIAGALPELTDEYVQKIGKFATVAEFKDKMRENICEEKTAEAKRERREVIAAKLIEAAKIDIPDLLVENETEAMRAERDRQVAQAGMTMDEYFKRTGKTKDEFEREERDYVSRQVKMRFILETIAEHEKIVPTEEEITKEFGILVRRHPDANPESLRNYIKTVLKNEKVLKLIEGGEK
jgi:FKBP-type peptidyl-prolyl cis-trans isomerase (trigger factor)